MYLPSPRTRRGHCASAHVRWFVPRCFMLVSSVRPRCFMLATRMPTGSERMPWAFETLRVMNSPLCDNTQREKPSKVSNNLSYAITLVGQRWETSPHTANFDQASGHLSHSQHSRAKRFRAPAGARARRRNENTRADQGSHAKPRAPSVACTRYCACCCAHASCNRRILHALTSKIGRAHV